MRVASGKGLVAAAVLALLAGSGSAAGVAAPATTASLPAPMAAWQSYYVGSFPKSVEVGDFTGDGRQDVVLGTGWYYDPTNDNKLFLFAQGSTGALLPPVRLTTDADGIDEEMGTAAGDVDGDGRTDLVLATLQGVDVFLQRDGGLSLTTLIDVPGARQVSLVDLDGDGHLDLVLNTNGGLVTLRGTATGGFTPPTVVNDLRYVEIETGDVSGDGLVDIVGLRENNVEVFAGRGDATFADPAPYHLHDYARMSRGMAIGDLNGDGRNDVAATISVNRPGAMIDVFTQLPGGTLGPASALTSYDIPQALVAADMNQDGRTDLVTLHGGWYKAGIYTQRADGTMAPEVLHAIPMASHYPAKAIAVGDFSGDGMPDIAAADHNRSLDVLRSATQVQTWGLGTYGQLGNSSTANSSTPSAPTGLTDVGTASAGGYHTLAVARDGHAWSWGLNHVGQLGSGSTVDRSAPTLVPGIDGVVGVSAGAFHSLAVKNDGTAWAWGWNAFGQLGIGSTVDRPLPVQLPGLSGVTAIAAGATHSLALKADGSVWTWGMNHVGQLGTGDTVNSLVPVRVLGPTNVVAVAAGGYHSLALTRDGVVWAWGWNYFGQLGTGQPQPHDPIPRMVTISTPSQAIAAGAAHSVALSLNTSVSTWGLNNVGQLGDGTTTSRPTPVLVNSFVNIRSVTAGWYHTLAVGTFGTTWAWGWNYFGQLGTGTTTDIAAPVAVPGLAPTVVTAGVAHSLAITARGG